ncbi:MAG: hypothetical protein JWO93_2444 [Micrococcaceae bacterium]|nr:hypothetical protein [Micrococcaceae bacterium]
MVVAECVLSSLLRVTKKASLADWGHQATPSRCFTFLPDSKDPYASAPQYYRCHNNCSMWETFGPDVLVALIGAFITVVIAIFSFWFRQLRLEREALRGLVDEIHHRRAFASITARHVTDAASSRDYERVSRSVLDVRNQVRQVRDHVRPNKTTQDHLSKMIRACNRYLEDHK